MTASKHIMLDLETMATHSYAPIVAIGACKFGPDGVEDKFGVSVSLSSNHPAQQIDGDTVCWWLRQKEEAREAIWKVTVDLPQALWYFRDWVGDYSNLRMWGNGSDFDNVILGNAYELMGISRPWYYRQNRCYRTISAMGRPRRKPYGTRHVAEDDAVCQALHLIDIAQFHNLNIW